MLLLPVVTAWKLPSATKVQKPLKPIWTLKNLIFTKSIFGPDGWFYSWDDGSQVAVNKADFTLNTGSKLVSFAAVFNGIHGTPGEDGKLQGYFDLLKIPYTGCSAAISALTFNKRYTVAVAAFSGIAVAKSMHLFKGETMDVEMISSELQLPLFVKPNNGGSSIGMSKVAEKNQLQAALDKAFAEDDQVLIEEFVSGREFTVGVCHINGLVETLPITEVISQNDFFDYEAKYQGKSHEVTPALIEESIAEKVRNAAVKIYHTFNCNGGSTNRFYLQRRKAAALYAGNQYSTWPKCCQYCTPAGISPGLEPEGFLYRPH